jgi:hypothetical protein
MNMDANTFEFIAELILSLVLGLILSWSVGLLPAIMYRYVIFKRPIEKKKVFWRLAPVVFVLMLAFKGTVAALSGTEPSGNPIPWIIIYYIGKWIMTRQPKRKERPSPKPMPPEPVSGQPRSLSLADCPAPLKPTVHTPPPTAEPQPTAAQPAEAPRKRGMHGCLLGFLIALGLLVVGVPLGLYIGGKAFVDYAKRSVEKTPLYLAVAANNIVEVDRLLAQGANQDEKAMMGHSPLIMAARLDYTLIAERLLKAGANPNQKDSLQWAPLHHAVKTDNANLDVITILVRYGADVNITDKHLRTPLHRAAQFGHVDAVRLLLRLGANPNAKDENGWTPLDRGAAHPAVRQVLEQEQ